MKLRQLRTTGRIKSRHCDAKSKSSVIIPKLRGNQCSLSMCWEMVKANWKIKVTTRTADYRPASVPPSLLVLPTQLFTDPPSRFTELALPHWLLPQRLRHPVFTTASLSYNAVLVRHDTIFEDQRRTVDSFNRTFASLHRKRMPTGDSLMPEDVRKAEKIRYKMTERADAGFGDEDTDELFGIVPDEDVADAPPFRTSPALMSHVAPSTDQTASEERSGAQVLPSTPAESFPSPMPLVNKRRLHHGQNIESNDFLTMMKMSMVQEQQRRDDEARRREDEFCHRRNEIEERRRREEDRQEDCLRREHENKMQQRFMETMLMMMT